MARFFNNQNLQRTNSGAQGWTKYGYDLAATVQAVYQDSYGRTRVNVQFIRSGIVTKDVLAGSSAPSVGDWGYVIFADGRRDTPVYVGAITQTAPLQSATVTAVGTGVVNVTLSVSGKELVNVPYLVAAAVAPQPALSGQANQVIPPSVGDSGVIGYLDGLASSPIYLGRLGTS